MNRQYEYILQSSHRGIRVRVWLTIDLEVMPDLKTDSKTLAEWTRNRYKDGERTSRDHLDSLADLFGERTAAVEIFFEDVGAGMLVYPDWP